MKKFTVRGIEEDLFHSLKDRAKKEGMSVNHVVLDAIREYTGLYKRKRFSDIHHDLDHLFGKWTKEEFDRIQGKSMAKEGSIRIETFHQR